MRRILTNGLIASLLFLFLCSCAPLPARTLVVPVSRANTTTDFRERWDDLEKSLGKPEKSFRLLFAKALQELNASQAELARKQLKAGKN